jgi:hypothetical protein
MTQRGVDRMGTIPDGVRHDQAEKLIVSTRRAIAARLRRSGATYQQIAEMAQFQDGTRCYPEGTSKANVYVDIKRGLAQAVTDLHLETTELREQTSQRLDDYLLKLQSGINAGDPKSIHAAVRIEEFRARLYGYQEPERHEVITVDALDVERRRLLDEINRRAALDARNGGRST